MTPKADRTSSAARRRRWGIKASRRGIYIGCPRLLDITWYGGRLTFRTFNHVLRAWPFKIGRSAW